MADPAHNGGMDQQHPQPDPNADPSMVTCAFKFLGADDYNFVTNWPGQIPAKGATLLLKGRDIKWEVIEVEWHIELNRKQGQLNRGVMVTLQRKVELS